MEQPLVSILMLTYNRVEYIKEAIDSISEQTYQNWELFIIDDGSTDTTREVLARYENEPRIRYIQHETNKGLIVRRKESLTYPTGKYVAVLDSDDKWISAEKLSTQVGFLESHPGVAVVGTHAMITDERGDVIGKIVHQTSDRKIRNCMLERQQFTHSSILIRKSMLDDTSGYPDISQAEDYDLCLQLGSIGELANIPEFMTAYRIHGGNTSKQKRRMAIKTFQVMWKHQREYPNVLLGILIGILRILKSIIT